MLTLINDKFTLLDKKVKIIKVCSECQRQNAKICGCLKCIISNGKEARKSCTDIKFCVSLIRKRIVEKGTC